VSNQLPRRAFLRSTAATTLGAAIAPSLSGLIACSGATAAADSWAPSPVVERPPRRLFGGGYGAIVEAGAELALPEGFRYARFAAGGEPLSDGTPTPGAHDGMACFSTPRRRGVVRLIRNHELAGARDRLDTWRAVGDPARAYDPAGPGGTSTVELRLTGDGPPQLVRSFMSLTGTCVNCAGGPTPWGSWLSCEETTIGTADGLPRDHGYVFEVPAAADGPAEPVPLKAMGRFVHEAIAVDPNSQVVYLTEDRLAAGFYRFIPNARGSHMRVGSLREGGKLQILALRDASGHDTRRAQQPGLVRQVRWVDIAEPDPKTGLPTAVFDQGVAQGAATFARLEGAWWGDGSVYFHATNGGDAQLGQVWRYRPGTDLTGGNADDGGELVLVFESRSRDVLSAPDNITVSPRGGLVLCEDSSGGCHIRGLSPRGEIFTFARNVMNDREFAGACFSPDGRILFVNIQGGVGDASDPKNLGMTLAIWGPWERGTL
jgi:uncharacterized protein